MKDTSSVEAVKSELSRTPTMYIIMFLLLGGQTGDLFSSSSLATEVREMRQEFNNRIAVEESATNQFEDDIEHLEDEIDDLWDEVDGIRHHLEEIKEQLP